jgi:hypothetical protein
MINNNRPCYRTQCTARCHPASVEFVDQNGGGPSVWLRQRQQKKRLASAAGFQNDATERE